MANLTDKQIIFANEYLVDLNATRAYKTWNFKYLENPIDVIIDCIAVLHGEYEIIRKQAAILLLKILLRDNFMEALLEDNKLYPIKRTDYRVRTWTKLILSKNKCQICGCTENLEAHHIIKWAEYPQGRIDKNNGICLCLKCHTNEHKLDQSYGMMRGRLICKS